MGFECGISLRNRETKKETGLFYLARLSDRMDNMAMSISTKLEDTRYEINYNKLAGFVDFLKKFHMIYIKYSDRVLDELEHYLYTNERKPKEVSKSDLSIVQDASYDCDCEDLWKINNFYEVFSMLSNIDDVLLDDFDLIYWRSY